MKLFTLMLPEPQLAKLRELSATMDLPIAELMRRAVEQYLNKRGKNNNSAPIAQAEEAPSVSA